MPDSIDVPRLTDQLPPDTPWRGITHLAEVDSTNAEVARRGEQWAPVLADHQTAGRGRLGRDWQERPGAGLAMSVLVPAVTPPGWLPLLTGLAVREALAGVDVAAALKWPNDVQLPADGHRKVCGILCQGAGALGAGVVVGIGINVHHGRGDLPTDTATSLRLVGAEVDRTDLAAGVLTGLARMHADLVAGGARAKGVRAAYRAACDTLGRRVVVHLPDGTREEALADGIDEDGRLVVDGPRGWTTVAAGDVQHIRAAGASRTQGQHRQEH